MSKEDETTEDWQEYENPAKFDANPPPEIHEYPCSVRGCTFGAVALVSEGFRCRPHLLHFLGVTKEEPPLAIPWYQGDDDE